MGAHLNARRWNILRAGRPMTLSRPFPTPAPAALPLTGGPLANFAPDKIAGAVQQGDALVEILNDEIAAAAWPGPPRRNDRLAIDGVAWAVLGVTPRYEGPTLIGYQLWLRGGDP